MADYLNRKKVLEILAKHAQRYEDKEKTLAIAAATVEIMNMSFYRLEVKQDD